MIDKNASQLIANGAMDECRSNARINTAGQAKNHIIRTDLVRVLAPTLVDVAI